MEKELVKTVAPSAGMGAILEEGQTTFRVWAPNANAVVVVGDFNGWKADQLILENEGNGYWSGITSEANEGDQYKYLIQNGERSFYKNDPYAFEVTNSDGNSIIRTLNFDWENDEFQLSSWNQLVIYELHVGTFYRPDPGKVGTFDDVISKLPYLQKLGINCIELLPVAEFAGGISWGYNPAHPFAVEQDYGGPDGLFRLIKAAHHHGIGVIMDVVYNHFGPSDVDLWQFDGWSENDKGGIYFYNDHRSDTPWGNTRPDYGRPEVRQYLRDNALMWIEKYHCDGLRMDATSYIRYEGGGLGLDSEILEGMILMRDINNELHQKYPNVITIAEDLKSQSIVTNPIDKGGIGYGTQWDMNFVHPVREVLTNVNDQDRDLQRIIDALCYRYENDAYSRVIYTESHDEVANGKARVPEEIQPGDAESVFAKKRAILGIVLCLTAPGIPMLFQGQEFLEDEYFKDTEGLDWQKYERLKGIERMVTDLINFRKGAVPGLEALSGQHVEILHTDHENKVLAYKRYDEEHQSVLIILNFSSQDLQNYELQLQEDNWQLRFNSTWKGYDDSLSDLEVAAMEIEQLENKLEGKLDIPAYGALIFSR